ncbi:MAG: transcription-repair coupling factor [Lachnospiraceae bacterium]|nr:transcription-repair coupling factor [Lachnospiraceae bacterium]
MEAIMKPLSELADYSEMKSKLEKDAGGLTLSGCVDSQKTHMIAGLGEDFKYKIIVTHNEIRAKEIAEDFYFYDRNVVVFPGKDLIFYQADIHGNELTKKRIQVLKRIMEEKPVTVITTFGALMTPMMPWEQFKQNTISLAINSEIEEHELSKKLVEMGYEKVYQVETTGQFSIRGGIIDIFDLTQENPYRIELWGENVESIRSFDVLSQRSIEKLHSVILYPAVEMIIPTLSLEKGMEKIQKEAEMASRAFREEFLTEEAHRLQSHVKELKEQVLELGCMVNLESYINYFFPETNSFLDLFQGKKTCIFLDEPTRIKEHATGIEDEFRESMIHRLEKGYVLRGQSEILFTKEEIFHKISLLPFVQLGYMEERSMGLVTENKYSITAKSIASYNHSFELLVKDLRKYGKSGYRIFLLSPSRTRAKRLAEDLRGEGLAAIYTEDPFREPVVGEIVLYYGSIKRGFEYPLLKFVVISESDIFGNTKKKKKKVRQYEGTKIRDFTELNIGDYVVHETHGLGIYRGIEKVEVEKIVKDYIKIEYRDGGNLYILATGLDLIQKYASADAKKPKLNKLGTREWQKTKSKVKGAVGEVARELVELYAIRQSKQGFSFSTDTVWQREFEEMFIFEETEDQLSAIEATKADMESSKIMDRLICGDVGYGKTEIAIRAAFKAVQDGKQVAFLVPTTILAQQHYNNFVQRMKEFPVRVDLMSRFRNSAQQKKTITDLKKGLVDIVIGTHRILSKDLEFKDLGLLIVDEEQRFGVGHKEKIKQIKDDVDVLTLTATPIPRTLHMSLIGIRDMSVLEEAPNERLPIQTYVCEYNEEMVREAIVRELTRGGQVYYVYNKVNTIADMTSFIRKLIPEANVTFAHGQMKEAELEKIMYNFINGEIDVLVSTTIIETGLDISNVNTMIIHDSDQMGLSQLYQLRGRVGRSNRVAYAFFMYQKNKVLKEVAEKRLQAIREFTDLGSGFRIAMKDLEIRGAGNLLGKKQHGHMEAVGYDLYCKMLNEAVKNLKGMPVDLEDFNTMIDLDVDAYIPPSYIMNEVQKLDIYKRIASVENQAESEEMKQELLDRFGQVPVSVENLLRIALIRVQAHKIYITEVKGKNERIYFYIRQDAKINIENLPKLLTEFAGKLNFAAKGNPYFVYKYKKVELVEKNAIQILELTEMILEKMEKLLLNEDIK